MRIVVNGQPRELPAGSTVVSLLDALGFDRHLVAVERNREVVTRALHATCALADGDVLEIVHFVGGG